MLIRYWHILVIAEKWTSNRDLSNISSSDQEVRNILVEQIRDACINVGFLYSELHFMTSTS